ncbi:MAG: phospholipase D-like domain-containing protein [Longimicrobiaceae bacterium]
MRARETVNGITTRAFAGSTGVLLGMNVTDKMRKGLLGFAIRREDVKRKETEWLQNLLRFEGEAAEKGEARTPIDSDQAPFQKFRWSDYRVYPGRDYRYTVHAAYAGAGNGLKLEEGPTLSVTTARTDKGEHRVLFNRAAAASQAFSRKFPNVEAEMSEHLRKMRSLPKEERTDFELPPEVREWLTRGVLEQIVGFIDSAKGAGDALDIAIYEYELEEIAAAVERAHQRGVQVRVVYHGKVKDEQTKENEHMLRGLPDEAKRPRVTNAICHHKFIVHSRVKNGERKPQRVLCGSTNFTHNGVYRQANVVHVVEKEEAAAAYLQLFEVLWSRENPAATRKWIDEHNPMKAGEDLFIGFSPRSKLKDIDFFVDVVKAAKRDVLFCTAFGLHEKVRTALLGQPNDPILRFGMENKRSEITGFHADRTADFSATAFLKEGLEGFLKESTAGQRGNILIHTKLVVVDFTSDTPTVISGSHNLSNNASGNNDENYLIVCDNPDVADVYGCELMRLYDHYRFRFAAKGGVTGGKPLALSRDDSWTDQYYVKDSLPFRDRLFFSGT